MKPELCISWRPCLFEPQQCVRQLRQQVLLSAKISGFSANGRSVGFRQSDTRLAAQHQPSGQRPELRGMALGRKTEQPSGPYAQDERRPEYRKGISP